MKNEFLDFAGTLTNIFTNPCYLFVMGMGISLPAAAYDSIFETWKKLAISNDELEQENKKADDEIVAEIEKIAIEQKKYQLIEKENCELMLKLNQLPTISLINSLETQGNNISSEIEQQNGIKDNMNQELELLKIMDDKQYKQKLKEIKNIDKNITNLTNKKYILDFKIKEAKSIDAVHCNILDKNYRNQIALKYLLGRQFELQVTKKIRDRICVFLYALGYKNMLTKKSWMGNKISLKDEKDTYLYNVMTKQKLILDILIKTILIIGVNLLLKRH